MSISYIIIGRWVKEYRLQKGISQAVLAEQVGMSVPYISYIETAKKRASLEILVRIANALGVTVDHLLNGNQTNDSAEYQIDIVRLMGDCTAYEKRIVYEIACVTKKSLRENRWLQQNEGQIKQGKR